MVLAIIIGQGAAMNDTAQGRMMARRAAISDVQRQTNGAGRYVIIEESFEDGVYTVKVSID